MELTVTYIQYRENLVNSGGNVEEKIWPKIKITIKKT